MPRRRKLRVNYGHSTEQTGNAEDSDVIMSFTNGTIRTIHMGSDGTAAVIDGTMTVMENKESGVVTYTFKDENGTFFLQIEKDTEFNLYSNKKEADAWAFMHSEFTS